MGRSNIKQVAQKRYQEISQFIKSLFETADEIAHSDLVYTFFHPLLRDQQMPEQYSKKLKGNEKFKLQGTFFFCKKQIKFYLHRKKT